MAGRGARGWLTEARLIVAVAGVLVAGALIGGGIWLSDSLSAASADAVTASPPLIPVPSLSSDTGAPSDPAPPAEVNTPVSLDGWSLILPVDADGNPSGVATQSKAHPIDPWLVRDSDGSLIFFAPATGAKVAGTTSTRTELFADNGFLFGSGTAHTLSATVDVVRTSRYSNDVCLAQIGGRKSVPLVMLCYRGGSVVAQVSRDQHSNATTPYTLATDVTPGTRFSFTITDAGDGSLRFAATYNGHTGTAVNRPDHVWTDTDVLFHAGDYQQATTGSSAKDGTQVVFYQLSAS